MTDETIAHYLRAIEQADAADTPAPAAALAELLAARLEGTDAPAARETLESFAPTAEPSPSEGSP